MTDDSMICAGIDVGKSHLGIAIHPGDRAAAGHLRRGGPEAARRLLQEHGVLVAVGFASGGYECSAADVAPGKKRSAARRACSRAIGGISRQKPAAAGQERPAGRATLIAVFTASLEDAAGAARCPLRPAFGRTDPSGADRTADRAGERHSPRPPCLRSSRHSHEIARLETCRNAHMLSARKSWFAATPIWRGGLTFRSPSRDRNAALCLVIRMPESAMPAATRSPPSCRCRTL